MASVSRVHVDDDGIFAATRGEIVLDVLFDERRIWSFWLIRDGEERDGGHHVAWPPALQRFLDGTTRLALVEHVSGTVVFDEELTFGSAAEGTRIAVVNAEGKPLGLDKSNRLAQTFDTRSDEHVAPLLDSIEEVLEALRAAGVDAFPAYGTLLGAVRGGKLIGHDSDADLGYVSEHTHPVDVVRESFALQRRLAEMGYQISRYSGAAFKVDVLEADGSVRGLDVFGGFLHDGNLILMGEIRTPVPAGLDLPARHHHARGPHPAGAGGHRQVPGRDVRAELAGAGPGLPLRDAAVDAPSPQRLVPRAPASNREEWDRHWSSAHRRGTAGSGPAASPTWVRRAAARRSPRSSTSAAVAAPTRTGSPRRGVPARRAGLLAPRRSSGSPRRRPRPASPRRTTRSTCSSSAQVLGWGARLADEPPAGAAPGGRWPGTSSTPPTRPGGGTCGASPRWCCAAAAGSTSSSWCPSEAQRPVRPQALPAPAGPRGRDQRARGPRRDRGGAAGQDPGPWRPATLPGDRVVVGSVDWWSNGRHEHAHEGLPWGGQGP